MTAILHTTRLRTAFVATVTALATVVAVLATAPASGADSGAGAWPQHPKDAGATRQADVPGPSDPGVKWVVDLADADSEAVDSDVAPEGYRLDAGALGQASGNKPILAPDGKLLVRARNMAPADGDDGGEYRLLALDPDDGSVVWEVPDVAQSCTQAVDSQGRIWVLRTDGSDDALEAIDLDGDPIPGSRVEGVERCFRHALQIGGDPETLFVYGNPTAAGWSGEAVTAYDISGAAPVERWHLNTEDADPPFDDLVGSPQRGVITDDRLYLAVRAGIETDEEIVEIVEIDLDDGAVVDRLQIEMLPRPDDDEDPDGGDIGAARLLLADEDTLVVGVTRQTGGTGLGWVGGVDLATGLDELAWLSRTGDDDTTPRLDTGPGTLVLGDGVVMTHAGGRNELLAFDVADGSVAWVGPHVLGAGAFTFRILADSDGAAYTRIPDPTDQLGRGIGKIGPDGQMEWAIPEGAIEADQNLGAGEELQAQLRWSVIGADGTFYFRERIESRIFALDNSGGLAWRPVLPDVDDRVSGTDRFETAADICAAFVEPNPDNVYVATGLAFPDALTGGVPAALTPTCMLLTAGSFIPDRTVAELERLQPRAITVLGGTAAVQDGVVAQFEAYTDGPVRRLAGADRFATAAAISADAFPDGAHTAFVATGVNFPDALAGVPAAAAYEAPILLATSAGLPQATAAELARLDLHEIIVLGGSGVVGDTVVAELENHASEVRRIAGADRFATAVQVGDLLIGQDPPSPLVSFVATGVQFPDALAGGAVAGAIPGPIYLVGRDFTPDSVTAELDRIRPDRLVIFGGAGAVSADNEGRLRAAAGLE